MEHVCDAEEAEEGGDQPEEEGFLVRLHAADKGWDDVSLCDPCGCTEKHGFAEAESDVA